MLERVAIAACPTLDRNSRWHSDPDRYRKNLEDRRLAREKRQWEARAERSKERQERREARAERRKQREEAQRREYERELERIEREMESSEPDPGQPDGGYTGPRCYDPGATWHPC